MFNKILRLIENEICNEKKKRKKKKKIRGTVFSTVFPFSKLCQSQLGTVWIIMTL